MDPWRANFSAQTTLGNILIIVNSFSYGAYIAVSRDLFRRYGALNVITWIFLIGTLVTLPVAGYAWSVDGLRTISPGVWAVVDRLANHPAVREFVPLAARFTALRDMEERLGIANLRASQSAHT